MSHSQLGIPLWTGRLWGVEIKETYTGDGEARGITLVMRNLLKVACR